MTAVKAFLTCEAEVCRCREILPRERTGCSRHISLGQRTRQAVRQSPADSRCLRLECLPLLASRTCAVAKTTNEVHVLPVQRISSTTYNISGHVSDSCHYLFVLEVHRKDIRQCTETQ